MALRKLTARLSGRPRLRGRVDGGADQAVAQPVVARAVIPSANLSGSPKLAGAIANGPTVAGMLAREDRAQAVFLVAGAVARATELRRAARAAAILDASALARDAELRRDQRAAGTLDVDAAIAGRVERLPKSQSVLLSFELERTLVPYTTERR